MSFIFSLVCLKIILVICVFSSESSNYPDDPNNRKLCAQKKYAVQYIGQICVPLAEKDKFTPDSIGNCQRGLKSECPEFNQAECMWYDWAPSDPKSIGNVKILRLPCCRLKYYAKYTWMEVFYMNQYGTSDKDNTSVFDIVEIHRLIKKHKAFGDNDQPDWPGSVQDSKGERGLPWKDLTNPQPFSRKLAKIKLCQGGQDADYSCGKDVALYVNGSYVDGFEKVKVPPISEEEKNGGVNIIYSNVATCTQIYLNKKKVEACKIILTRLAIYKITVKGELKEVKRTTPFCEGQFYNGGPDGGIKIRYAYYAYPINGPKADEGGEKPES